MKPIFFNTDMVRAILDGRKTVTRQVVKPQPRNVCYNGELQDSGDDLRNGNPLYVLIAEDKNNALEQIVPPYQPGDILYVREVWKQATYDYAGGGYGITDTYLYRADEPIDTTGMMVEEHWHPSIHMPKEAARIFLRVTEVWVERLQEITEAQAIAEGIRIGMGAEPYFSCRDAFSDLWDSAIKEKQWYGWGANPWAWKIQFECLNKEDYVNDK